MPSRTRHKVAGRGVSRLNLKLKPFLGLLGLTVAAFLIHGYHPWSEDAETYLPGIEKVLNPHLFPIGSEYFQLHAHLTWFPQLIAGTVQVLHLPLPWTLLLWQSLSFFLFLAACWYLLRLLIPSERACWAGVALVAALFTMPVAGTALYLMDPFLNPRNIIASAEIFAVARLLQRKYFQAVVLLFFAISIHPFMSAFTASFAMLLVCLDRWPARWSVRTRVEETVQVAGLAAPLAPAGNSGIARMFSAPTQAYDDVASTHRYQFLSRWTWYEVLGAVAPLAILWWFSLVAKARGWRPLELLTRALAIYGAIYFVAGLIVSLPRRLEVFSLLQPMRSLQLLYILMLLIGGGLLGEFVLRNRAWRWLALFLPLSGGMLYAQRALYPMSAHIEWPSAAPRNPWVAAFLWAKNNTPENAIFALDPFYMQSDDQDGFRAIAQRSQLADGVKDSGVVELFPSIADSWMAQVNAQRGIDHFQPADFARLQQQYNVSWVVLRQSSAPFLDCPYQNAAVKVCRLPEEKR